MAPYFPLVPGTVVKLGRLHDVPIGWQVEYAIGWQIEKEVGKVI